MQHRILLFVSVVSLVVSAVACNRFTQSPNSVAGGTPQLVEKHLSAFRPIEGTNYMIADVSGDPQAN